MPFDQAGFDAGEVVRVLTPLEQQDLDKLRSTLASLRKRGSWCTLSLEDGETGARCIVGWLMFHTCSAKNAESLAARRLFPVVPGKFDALYRTNPTLTVAERASVVMGYNDSRHSKRPIIRLVERAIAKLETV